VSRSLHTQKLDVRAERRLDRPYSKRQAEADRLSGRDVRYSAATSCRPRIEWQKPLSGTWQPLKVRDVRTFLKSLGPPAAYGLRVIRLKRESAFSAEGIVFAEYVMPGEIRLYSVPANPWELPFILACADRAAFERHGARVEVDFAQEQTTVRWSADGLKQFVLYEVLAHELGHHMLQYRKGKRTEAVCRWSDHERRAHLHSPRAFKTVRMVDGPQ
jgi:hypothetical protein